MLDVKQTISKIINWISNREYAFTGYGTSQGITNYTSSSNAFTVPKDGMLRLQCRYVASNYIGVTIANSDLSNQMQFQVGGNGSANQNWAIPVYRGQKVWRHSNNGQYNYIDYIPFVGGVLLNSIFKAFSHLQKIGGGINAGHQKTHSKNTELDKSTVHNSLCNCLWKQSKLKYSYNSTAGKRLYVCMLGISKLNRMGRLRISGACRQSNNKAVVPFVQSERHKQSYARLGAICEDISVIASERRWAYA